MNVIDLIEDPKFENNQSRVENRNELQKILQDTIKLLSTNDIMQSMLELNVPAGKVKNLADVFENEEIKHFAKLEAAREYVRQRLSNEAAN